MTEGGKSIRALTGDRELTQMISEYKGTVDTNLPDFKGWQSVTTSSGCLFYETYFDLTGYMLDDLTLLPKGAMLQDPGLYSSTHSGSFMHVMDILSQERLDATELYDSLVVQNNVPGMMETVNNFEQITYGSYRLFLPTTSFTPPTGINVYLPASQTFFGSGDAVVVEKLYAYRFVMIPGIADTKNLLIPASRFVLLGRVVQEDDKEYLMRLKRSYELQQN